MSTIQTNNNHAYLGIISTVTSPTNTLSTKILSTMDQSREFKLVFIKILKMRQEFLNLKLIVDSSTETERLPTTITSIASQMPATSKYSS